MMCILVAHGQKLPFTNYTTANGLSHNRTHVIQQDGKGYMWIGTELGINRYDGRTFKHYPTPGNPYKAARYVNRCGERVVFSIDQFGIAICYGDSVRFIRLKTPVRESMCGVIAINDSTFYQLHTINDLYRVTNDTAIKITLPKWVGQFTDIFQDREKNIWLLGIAGLTFFKDGDMTRPERIPFFDHNYAVYLNQDANGDIYVASYNGVFRYPAGSLHSIATVKPEAVLPPPALVTSITFDRDDNVWMASTYKGLLRYNKRTGKIDEYGVAHGVVSQNLWCVFCDQENDLWVTSENGIGKLSTQFYASYDFTNTDYQNVKSGILWDDTTLLFGNLINIYSYRAGQVQKVDGYSGMAGYMRAYFAKMPDGKLILNINNPKAAGDFDVLSWLCSFEHNKLIKEKLISGVTVYLDQGTPMCDGKLFLNTSAGLKYYNNGGLKNVAAPMSDGKRVIIVDMTADAHGNIWLINNFRQLIRYRVVWQSSDTAECMLQLMEKYDTDKLGTQAYYNVFTDSRGWIWLLGRTDGICVLIADGNGRFVSIKKLSRPAISSGYTNAIIEDADHHIWLGTASGLDKILVTADTFTVEKDVYGGELCGKFIFFLQTMNDLLFVGTTGCMGVVNINRSEAKVAPRVYISGLKINSRDNNRLLLATPKLATEDNNIAFTFTGISFKNEREIKYSYLLDGVDQVWSDPQPDHEVTYSHMRPGAYTFRVKARSADGLWSAPAVFTFSIAQPFYTTWWFLLLSAAAIALVVYAIYRYRISQILKIDRIRQNISKDLHDDIGATVSSINILASMASNQLVSEHKRNEFIETIQQESKHVSQSLNDIVWSITPKNDSLEIMFARMQRYASELFEAENIAYEILLPKAGIKEISIEMAKRQHVYLIFKEAVNNLVKYAQATSASVTLDVSRDKFTMVISDNGKGFDPTPEHNSGNGLFNMRRRAQDIGARISINSSPGNGTTITLAMDI